MRLLVDQWRKMHVREQQFADALAALRDEMRSDREPESGVYYEVDEARAYNRAIDADLARLDATIAALGLPEPTTKEK